LAERHLRRLPAKNRTERAAALELLIRALLDTNRESDRAQAQAALEELQSIAAAARTAPLRAAASLSSGLMAHTAGRLDAARREMEDAVDLFTQCGAPFEAARARLDLAVVLDRLGRPDAAIAEAERALDGLQTLDARHDVLRAQALRERLTPPPEGKRP